jgi:carboxylesterase
LVDALRQDLDDRPLAPGEARGERLRRPFWFAGRGARARKGVLLVHGFTGTPFEMRLLGESLAERGYTVHGPQLAAHCQTADVLAASTWRDWMASVEAAFDRLRREVDRVYVCGLSLGALLTLELAQRRGPADLAGIAALATPLWLARPAELAIAATRRLGLRPRLVLPKWAGSDVADPEMRARNDAAQGGIGLPLVAVLSLRELSERVRGDLPDVRVPTLVVHGRQDHTAPFACMRALVEGLRATTVDTLVVSRSYHVLPIDRDRLAVADAVARHVDQTFASARPGSHS